MSLTLGLPTMVHGSPTPTLPSYFVIAWGTTHRWTGKYKDVRRAANEAFGMCADNMRAWNLGPNIGTARKLYRKLVLDNPHELVRTVSDDELSYLAAPRPGGKPRSTISPSIAKAEQERRQLQRDADRAAGR